ncbi:molybdopterin containing oxidoreductase [Alteromonadaceae bacterium M269]|nr:molybdopterin containing oxidoreductase [Alteromonadaceae bacterium M269]
MSQKEQKSIGIHELYGSDPDNADLKLWGRKTDTLTRRGFLRNSGLSALSAAIGASIPFARFMPAGLIPAAFADSTQPFKLEGKDGLTILNDHPINAETPAHLLDDKITPASRLFVRNNGIPPEVKDTSNWQLEIGGESCERPQSFSIEELKSKFKHYTYQLQLECGGNGRSEYNPPAKGNQWTTGAVGCPEWTGVRLRDVLKHCGVKDDAVYIGYYSADKHLSGDPSKNPISRGVPMHKANEDETLIAWAMNGEDIPQLHGYPLRLICSGWPASASGKWLKKLVIRNKVHDGAKMTGTAYRVPCKPVKPGQAVADEDMCIIESMPVKSLITYPKSGVIHEQTKKLSVRGHAWAGDLQVKEVFVSIDFGATWSKATLEKPKNRLAWQHWNSTIELPETGYYEIWARAVDEQGKSQPMVLPGWNPKGYLNNACHRIAVKVV